MKQKQIIMISTGGTIASKKNPETGLLTAGLMTGEELSAKCQLPDHIDLQVISALQIPSNHMTFDTLSILKEKIEDVLLNKNIDGIVITHGTDTLEETAYFLDLVIDDLRPVVITGSQRGPDEMGTDAFVNLRQSILLAASDKAFDLGVLTLFNERIYAAKYIKKIHASNVAGFGANGYGYLGTVDQNTIKIVQKPLKKEKYKLTQKLPTVEIVKNSLGSSDLFIRYAIEKGIKGLIIEAPGRGHVPPLIMDSIREAIRSGMLILLTTNADEGDVKVIYDFPGSVYDMKNAGAILASDYDAKKARIKLAVLLATNQVEDLKTYF